MKKPIAFFSFVAAAVFSLLTILPQPAHAVPLLDGYGGPAGYGQLIMQPNDDQSSAMQSLLWGLNFYGTRQQNYWVNNNGNITFGGPLGTFTPRPFPIAAQPMIAPFWGDVDTRCGGCGAVYAAAPNANTVVITWNNVGYYSSHSNLLNDFQLVIINRADTNSIANNPLGDNFDVQFRYNRLEWTTGDASGGSGGFGGTPAQAGYDAGNVTDSLTLPGSQTHGVLQLANTTNVIAGPPGLWVFAIRDGLPPGGTSSNPLLPVVQNGNFNFQFVAPPVGQRIFIDPFVAIGYDYIVNSGPNFQTVLLPTGIGDNSFDLFLWDGANWVFNTLLTGGVEHDFGVGGVDRFRILGIEVAAGLDPNNTLAFVTGLSFVSGGQLVNMNQNPITFFVQNGNNVPIPGTIYLILAGLLGAGFMRRRSS